MLTNNSVKHRHMSLQSCTDKQELEEKPTKWSFMAFHSVTNKQVHAITDRHSHSGIPHYKEVCNRCCGK